MTKEQIEKVVNVAFDLADGTKVIFPVIAPFVSAIESIVKAAMNHGVEPVVITPEQQAAIAAGMAAAKSSAVTTYIEKKKK